MNEKRVTKVADPVDGQDATNKQWVSKHINGILELLAPINIYGNKISSSHDLYIQKSLGYLLVKEGGTEEDPHRKLLEAFDSSVEGKTFTYIK